MRFFLISDNVDTAVGLRLCGIDGVVVHTREEVEKALLEASDDDGIGIVLITSILSDLCRDMLDEYKLKSVQPLVVTIPDRHDDGHTVNNIKRYVNEAIGLKL